MDSETHSKFTGDAAEIGKNEGDKFSAFSGYATGKNIKLEKDKLIEQTWRASDWPDGHYSIIKITLESQKNGTLLIFEQTDVPKDFFSDISDGWNEYYWKPLNAMFKK
jgi:activator of HSP90 ATPase